MIKTWQERLMNSCRDPLFALQEPLGAREHEMKAEIDELRAALATARKDERERCAKTAELGWHYGTANAIRNLIDEG